MATEIALPGAPSWATTALGIVLPKNVTATYDL